MRILTRVALWSCSIVLLFGCNTEPTSRDDKDLSSSMDGDSVQKADEVQVEVRKNASKLETDREEPSAHTERQRAIDERKSRLPPPAHLDSVTAAETHIRLLNGTVTRNVIDKNRVYIVEFTDNAVIDDDLIVLTQLSELKSLRLFDAPLIDGSGLRYVEGCNRLESIFLSSTGFSDEHFVHLRDLPNLGIQSLSAIPGLSVLNVSGTSITDQSLANLATWPNLHNLDVSNTAVTDAGLQLLEKCPRLAYLNVSGTQISKTTLLKLAAGSELREINARKTRVVAADIAEAVIDKKVRILVD